MPSPFAFMMVVIFLFAMHEKDGNDPAADVIRARVKFICSELKIITVTDSDGEQK